MILELVMESAFAIVDIYFVGKLGASAVAVVGLTETYLYLLYAVAMGLATPVTAIIARRVGEKTREAASRTAVQQEGLGVAASLHFLVAGILLSNALLAMNGATECGI